MDNRFKAARMRKGITQKEAAITLGVSVQAVSYWETGARMPSKKTLSELADLYGVTVDYLIGREEERDKQKAKESLSRQFGREQEPLIENMLDRLERLTPEQLDQLERYIRFLEQEGK